VVVLTYRKGDWSVGFNSVFDCPAVTRADVLATHGQREDGAANAPFECDWHGCDQELERVFVVLIADPI
jgi:hypothetical protein